MLAVHDPGLQRPAADGDVVNVAAVQAPPQRRHPEPRRVCRHALRHEVEVPLVRVRVEVGKICGGLQGRVAPLPAQRAVGDVVPRRWHAAPALPVVRDANLGAVPGGRVQAQAGIVNLVEDEPLVTGRRRAADSDSRESRAEGEPLEVAASLELRDRICLDAHRHQVTLRKHEPSVARVEAAGDADGGDGGGHRGGRITERRSVRRRARNRPRPHQSDGSISIWH
mmetsp:Transcript_24437/g.78830  ORF Transcript_24437/g.78830 Transcript_24437/m.78830 type:complete len:225 (+) Transcript_24437:1873-2547(+)